MGSVNFYIKNIEICVVNYQNTEWSGDGYTIPKAQNWHLKAQSGPNIVFYNIYIFYFINKFGNKLDISELFSEFNWDRNSEILNILYIISIPIRKKMEKSEIEIFLFWLLGQEGLLLRLPNIRARIR